MDHETLIEKLTFASPLEMLNKEAGTWKDLRLLNLYSNVLHGSLKKDVILTFEAAAFLINNPTDTFPFHALWIYKTPKLVLTHLRELYTGNLPVKDASFPSFMAAKLQATQNPSRSVNALVMKTCAWSITHRGTRRKNERKGCHSTEAADYFS